jgi:pyruvate/2-oxoglutarate/acetoin dehydrogenase E1 component
MRLWMISNKIATQTEIDTIDIEARKLVLEGKRFAWAAYQHPMQKLQNELITLLEKVTVGNNFSDDIKTQITNLKDIKEPVKKDLISSARQILYKIVGENSQKELATWIQNTIKMTQPHFSSNLFSNSKNNILSVSEILPQYADNAENIDGRYIMRDNFDAIFSKYPESLIFGEDAGAIGDVNQGLEGMQEKYGETRVADVGIREASIIGQGIGMAMRGLRPIAEIQYLDYLLYAIQIMSDDLATLQYRSAGRQKSPLIIRTRGHRLEGIWHSGSPMGMIINAVRGIHVLVPRNMTKAAGFYNTLLKCDEPALVIECLNGYRLKEKAPNNYGDFCTPIGIVETIKSGSDITVVSYGSTLRLVEQAAKLLDSKNISCEIIDIQSLLPFDIKHDIVKSLEKTNRLLIVDEDVSGGASAFILQQVLEVQNGYQFLDSKPQTLTAQAHRPAYGTDGDYFSKPSIEDIYEKIYAMMVEANPSKYQNLY